MDGSHAAPSSSLASPAPFLTKTYDMVDDPATDDVVSWGPTVGSFVVWKLLEFARDLLPKYFKHNNFSSFVRQLNTYGFRKADPEQWEFANEEFVRGQRHLLKNIHRRKPVYSRSLHNNPSASADLSESEKHELEEEIEKLKHDKGVLTLDLEKHIQLQYGMEKQMQCLEERLHLMEQRQRDTVSFLSQVVQRPGFLSDLFYQSDLHHKKRGLWKIDDILEDANMGDSQILALQSMDTDSASMQMFDAEHFDNIESSISSLEAFFRNVTEAFGGNISYDDRIPSWTSAVVLTEIHACTVETNENMRPLSPKLFPVSPCLGDTYSSPEMAESMSHVDSIDLPRIETQKDTPSNKASEMDVNSASAVNEVHMSKIQATGLSGVNDVFWEQFLTERPGSTDTQEVQSKRQDPDEEGNAGKLVEMEPVWWNRKNVDQLTEHMGHLTPAAADNA